MQHFRKKMKSQEGASLVLALLFFLICAFVAASVLMAAVTNAGKYRSNQEEQQKQLALSSAVQMLCDELAGATYTGKYMYVAGDTGKVIRQSEGVYSSEMAEFLQQDFDANFADTLTQNKEHWNGEYDLDVKNTTGLPGPHDFVITPQTGTELDAYPVKVTLEVTESYAIYITAQMKEDDGYMLYAEVTPTGTVPSVPTLPTSPVNGQEYLTNSMTWKIGWISLHNDRE